jgi:hypothetical protein
MPPASSILDRAAAAAHVSNELPATLNVLRDIVDEGVNLLGRVSQTQNTLIAPRPLHRSLLLLFRHVIEMADGFEELVRIGVVTPAGLQMRAILETHMQMFYLLEQRSTVAANPIIQGDAPVLPIDPSTGAHLAGKALDDLLDQRGLAYQVGELRRQLHHLQRYSSPELTHWYTSVTGKAQPPAAVVDPSRQAGVTAEIARVRTRLASADLAPLDAEFTKVRKKAKFDPSWYALYNGPQKVRALARTVGLAFQYDMLYAETSQTMHGTDITGQLRPATVAGKQAIAPLRELGDAKDLINSFILHMLRIFDLVIGELRPSDNVLHAQWVQRWTPHIIP